MDFYEVVDQVVGLLHRRGRLTYQSLKVQFQLDDEQLESLKAELLYAYASAVQSDAQGLVWVGETKLNAPAHESGTYTPPYLPETFLSSQIALEGERKHVTVLFCDLQNSTSLAEQIGPEKMHALLNRFFELAINTVYQYEGTINQFLGDGFMALFGAPVAHEDHARRAVLAALDLQRTMRDHHEELGGRYGVELSFRMGVNTGMVVIGSIGNHLRLDYTAIGETTNLAARFEQIAEPGTILVGETTSRLLQGYVRLEALEPVQVKGKMAPVAIYKVIGLLPKRSPIVSRGERVLSTFVGRERELDTLADIFHRVQDGRGQVVGILAEAGGGKSRLLYEFRQRLRDEQVTYLEGRCLSYGRGIPYHPLVDVLRHHFNITEADRAEVVREKVGMSLQAIGLDVAASAPYLLHLLGVTEETQAMAGLTPETLRARTFEALQQMFLQGSQQQPLIVAIEDYHWIDSSSQDYLSSWVERLAGVSVLLLTTYRPDARPPWFEKSYATQIALRQLSPEDGVTVMHSVLQGITLPERVEQVIIEKAEGNPFFLEELARTVSEQDDAETAMQVPNTIQGVLSARIDRLPEPHKHLLKTASVLGREFSPRLLGQIWDGSEALDELLSELQRLQFVYARADTEESVYVFKHALTQEVAYESLLTTRRQFFHARAGLALETLYAAWLTERAEELAHHFSRGEMWEKAFHYLLKSGHKARQAFANREAIAFYTQAIDVSERLMPAVDEMQRLAAYEGRGVVRLPLSQYDEAIADFQSMRQLARAAGNPQIEGESLWLLGRAHLNKSSEDQIPFMERYAQEGLRLAQRTGDQKILARSLTSLGLVQVEQRNLQDAMRAFEQAAQISRREGDKSSLSRALTYLCMQHYFQGDFRSARPFAAEGAAVAHDLFDSSYELLSLGFLCQAHWSLGDYGQALTVASHMSTTAQARQHVFYLSRAKNTLGWFYRELGDVSRALEYDRESVELRRTTSIANAEISALVNLGFDYLALGQYACSESYFESTLDRVQREGFGSHRWRWLIRLRMGLAELCYRRGDYRQALGHVEEGLREAQQTASQKYIAQGLALRGNIAAKLGDLEAAGTELQRAFTLADALQSPSLIYPIAANLGTWYATVGREGEAVSMYGRAKATIEQMATAIEDTGLRSIFLHSALVQDIHQRAARLGQ